eukprot:1219303-Amphidinium_carterae.1
MSRDGQSHTSDHLCPSDNFVISRPGCSHLHVIPPNELTRYQHQHNACALGHVHRWAWMPPLNILSFLGRHKRLATATMSLGHTQHP